ncbi:MAG: GNAT family N-acetyltransferase [Kosmotogaceae bacterium]|nr:GNAT family N-acetyltransferase [Kosmotogaceae bacterium]
MSKDKALIKTLPQSLMGLSVIERNTKGMIFVDNQRSPNLIVVWNYCDTVLVGGESERISENQLSRFLFETFLPLAKERDIPFINFCSSPTVLDKLLAILKTMNPRLVKRRFFQANSMLSNTERHHSIEFTAYRINEELLNPHLDYSNVLRGWVYSFWKDLDSFEKLGGGYALIKGKTIISWCLGVYRFGDRIEVGLETVKEFRNQGLGLAVSKTCVDEFLSSGLVVDWHCDSENYPSLSIAINLGLKEKMDYEVCQISI